MFGLLKKRAEPVSAFRERLAVCLTTALSVFGKPKPDRMVLDGWLEGLAGIEAGPMEAAFARWLKERQTAPTPAGIREMAVGQKADGRALEAWAGVLGAIRHPSQRAKVMADRLVAKVVGNLGGLEVLCTTETKDLHVWTRQRFLDVYRALEGGAWDDGEHRRLSEPRGGDRGAVGNGGGERRGLDPGDRLSDAAPGMA